MRTELVSSPEQLEKCVPAWDRLAANAIEKNVFYNSWMLLPALRNFGDEAVQVLLIWDSARLIGLFPLRPGQPFKHIPFQCHAMWKYQHCYLCTPLIDRESYRECLAEFRAWLKTWSTTRPGLEMPNFIGNGAFESSLIEALKEYDTEHLEHNFYHRGLLTCNMDSKAYLTTNRKSRTIQGTLQKMRKLERKGKVDFRVTSGGEELNAWVDDFLALEQAGWKGRNGTALKSTPEGERFFREVMLQAARKGNLLATQLYFEDILIGAICCFFSDRTGYAFKTAFNEDFASYSPGLLVILRTTEYILDHTAAESVDSCSLPGDMLFKLWRAKRPIRTLLINDRNLKSVSLIFSMLTLKRAARISPHYRQPSFDIA